MHSEHITDTCPKCGTELMKIVFNTSTCYILRCPKCGFDKVVYPALEKDGQDEKPPLGVMPAELAAWSRIADLVDAIRRHCESTNGNAKLVKKWANEITWQCALIESMEEDE